MARHTSILDSPAISGRYFRPQPRQVSNPFVVEVPGAQLACYAKIVEPNGLTLVHFHGNIEAVADYLQSVIAETTRLGLNALFVEYRGYGGSTGKAELTAMLDDGEIALAAAGILPEQAILLGRTVGSLYAIELAYRQPRIGGLIVDSGIADLASELMVATDLTIESPEAAEVHTEVERYFNHKEKLSKYEGPLLMFHAEEDDLIDVSHAERNYDWAASPAKRLVRFPLGDCNSIMSWNWEAYFQAIGSMVKAVRARNRQ